MTARGGRIDPAEFRRLVDEAKDQHNLSDVVARDRKVIKAGREKKALCPFHNERNPSLQISDAKGTYYCQGCGATGDIVKYVRETQGLGFMDALRWLGMAELPRVDPAERAKAVEEDAAERARAIDDARFVWGECVSIEGTPADTYLRACRGITMEPPPSIRFGFVPTGRDKDTGEWKRPYPAMVCACTDDAGEIVGLQRVFLRDDGRDKRWGKTSKLSLGRPRGAAVRLGDPAAEIIMCEGPEDGLSLAQELPDRTVYVALGTAMMPEMLLPPAVRSVMLAGQNDKAGRAAVQKAAAAIAERGLAVRMMFPDPAFKDWNDQLRGIRA